MTIARQKMQYKVDHDPNLLCVDIDAGKPTAKARMGVIPAHDHFRSAAMSKGRNE